MRQQPGERTIVLFPDRTRLLKNSLPSLPTALLAIPVVMAWKSKKRALHIVSFLTGALLLFWESLYLPLWFRLLLPRPTVIVNAEGITYNPPAPWFVNFALQIRWQEIAEILPYQMSRVHWLAIVPKDQEAFIQQQKILRPRRFPILAVMMQVHTPFFIPEPNILPSTVNELLAQMQAKFQHEIEANNIKIGEEQKITFKTGQ